MTTDSTARNALVEADEVAGPTWLAHVLEPSPPAVTDPAWFADDPVAPRPAAGDATALVPTGIDRPGSTSWNSWLADHPEHADWVSRRWLGGDRSLASPPTQLVATRLGLHRLAAYVIAPTRFLATGKFGLRWTLGGFGTPFFGNDRQIRVEGTELVDQRGDQVLRVPITTLQAAAEFLETEIKTDAGAEDDSPPVGDINETLAIDQAASEFLGGWYGMAFAALEQVRAQDASIDASRPQLWPGHFDPAIEVGGEDHRGSYGASPGDPSIPEPYLYVSVWWPDRLDLDSADPVWNAPSFTGAILKLSEFGAGDPVDRAASFFASTRDVIAR